MYSSQSFVLFSIHMLFIGLPWWLSGKESACNAEDLGWKDHLEGNGYPLQYSCLGNPWTEEPGRLFIR